MVLLVVSAFEDLNSNYSLIFLFYNDFPFEPEIVTLKFYFKDGFLMILLFKNYSYHNDFNSGKIGQVTTHQD